MNSLFYRSQNESFTQLFEQAAQATAGSLPFTNKEEYLQWVKTWKDDYRLISLSYRLSKLEAKRYAMLRSSPYAGEDAKIRLAETENYLTSISAETKAAIEKVYLKHGVARHHLAITLLVQRRAGKIQAHAQWKARQEA